MILKPQGLSCHPCFCSNRQNIGLIEITKSSATTVRRSPTSLYDASVPVDVIGTSDIIYGTLIALVLAFTASFLQGRRNRDDFAPSEFSSTNTTSLDTSPSDNDSLSTESSTTFDADSWKEISRPESYIFYKQKLRERESKSSSESSFDSERVWVLLALLALFVPIFSVEFFFALSRQLICGGDPMNQSDWSELLCSPAMTNFE
jgi:hypothetical protein